MGYLVFADLIEQVVERGIILLRDEQAYLFAHALVYIKTGNKLFEVADMTYLESELFFVELSKSLYRCAEHLVISALSISAAQQLYTRLHYLVRPAFKQRVVFIYRLIIVKAQRALSVFKSGGSKTRYRYSRIGAHNYQPALRIGKLVHTFLLEIARTAAEKVVKLYTGGNYLTVTKSGKKRCEFIFYHSSCKTLLKEQISRALRSN